MTRLENQAEQKKEKGGYSRKKRERKLKDLKEGGYIAKFLKLLRGNRGGGFWGGNKKLLSPESEASGRGLLPTETPNKSGNKKWGP